MTWAAPPVFFFTFSWRSFSRAAISPRLCGQATAAASATAETVRSERVKNRIDEPPRTGPGATRAFMVPDYTPLPPEALRPAGKRGEQGSQLRRLAVGGCEDQGGVDGPARLAVLVAEEVVERGADEALHLRLPRLHPREAQDPPQPGVAGLDLGRLLQERQRLPGRPLPKEPPGRCDERRGLGAGRIAFGQGREGRRRPEGLGVLKALASRDHVPRALPDLTRQRVRRVQRQRFLRRRRRFVQVAVDEMLLRRRDQHVGGAPGPLLGQVGLQLAV